MPYITTNKIRELVLDIAKEYNYGGSRRQEIINIIQDHIRPSKNGGTYLSLPSILSLLMIKEHFIQFESEGQLKEFNSKSIFEQLKQIKKERDNDPKVIIKIKKELYPMLKRFEKETPSISQEWSEQFVKATDISFETIRLWMSFIRRTHKMDIPESEKILVTLHYYLSMLEGQFEDYVDFIIGLKVMLDGPINYPVNKKQKKIPTADYCQRDEVTLYEKKIILEDLGLKFIARYIDNQLRNAIAHQQFLIKDDGTVYLIKYNRTIENIFSTQTQLAYVLDGILYVLREPMRSQEKKSAKEIIIKISKAIKKGQVPSMDWFAKE